MEVSRNSVGYLGKHRDEVDFSPIQFCINAAVYPAA